MSPGILCFVSQSCVMFVMAIIAYIYSSSVCSTNQCSEGDDNGHMK